MFVFIKIYCNMHLNLSLKSFTQINSGCFLKPTFDFSYNSSLRLWLHNQTFFQNQRIITLSPSSMFENQFIWYFLYLTKKEYKTLDSKTETPSLVQFHLLALLDFDLLSFHQNTPSTQFSHSEVRHSQVNQYPSS